MIGRPLGLFDRPELREILGRARSRWPRGVTSAGKSRFMDHDILSDMLRSVRLSGATFFDVDISSPWVAAAPPSRSIAAFVMPGAQHVIEYHVLVRGTCWARVTNRDSEQAIRLSAGSIVAFPQGDGHVLASHPDLDAEPDLSTFDQAARARSLPLHLDYRHGAPQTAHLICGFLGCDMAPFNPLIDGLPRILHVADGYGGGDGLLGQLISATVREAQVKGLGSGGVLSKLSELIFIEVVRRYVETLPRDAGGWLAGLRHPGVGRALRLLHAEAARDWTVAELAREAGLSRTVLAERFTELLGMPPMTYLANWRMQRAAAILAAGPTSLSRVAAAVGYDSEAAFSRAFKRSTGLSPAQWRKSRLSRDGENEA
jgi:AraC-like DNA-binding protein